MTEVEHNMSWSSVEEHIVYSEIEYDNGMKEDLKSLPTIVVESSDYDGTHSDAPIVIYPNDPSVVGAEEVVMEEQTGDSQWSLPPDAEEEVEISASSEQVITDDGEIPLNDQSYATFHPFPCDFCCRRFKKKANLINHMVAHQTQRPHFCNVCSARFMRKCDLVNHQKIHSYVPNRINRAFYDDEQPAAEVVVAKRSRRSTVSGSPRRRKSSPERSPSPTEPESPNFKPSSYVDEDVKLLLEMTTKLHESRKSEGSDSLHVEAPSEANKSSSGTADKPYVCTKCNRCFARESALVSHSQVHAEDSFYNCDKCGSRFFTVELLKDHYSKKHHTPYVEEVVDEVEDKKGDKGSYTGDERFGTFYCGICAISFHRTELLKQHKRTVHPKRDDYSGLYSCGSCHSMFLTNEKLLNHLRASESCQQHVCLICGEQFTDQAAVQTHIKEKHGRNLPPFTCTYCGKNCRVPKALKKHLWIHLPGNGFSCKHCRKKFHNWNKLTRHMSIHETPKPAVCDECDEEYPDSRALASHRSRHHSSSSRKFFCNECGKGFGSRSSQQIHNRIHTGERPYGCRYCWKAFADGGTLRKHERIHTGEKPYVCAVCPRAFNQRVVLREHIRSHHSGSVNKLGFSNPVYICPVCGASAAGSEELALHLVKHSDDNTLRNRNAPPGTRHYKRRKKSESQYYSGQEFDEADYLAVGSDTESIESEKLAERKKAKARLRTSSRTTKAREPPPPEPVVRKAKMINTTLKTLERKIGKRGVKKRVRRVETSVTVLNTKATTPPPARTVNHPDADDDEVESQNVVVGRPRTKNVNYETLRALRGLPQARFPAKPDAIAEEEIKEEVVTEEEGSNELQCYICNHVSTSKADLLFHVQIHI